jgi:hypothetical protein
LAITCSDDVEYERVGERERKKEREGRERETDDETTVG